MIKIGFICDLTEEWMGGLNYIKNLFFAINTLKNKEIKIFIFLGKKSNINIKNNFSKYGKVIQDNLFDRYSLKWFLSKIEKKIFKSNFFLESFFKKFGIQILSHTSETNFKKIKTINWISDFQHIHLPKMFSKKEIDYRNSEYSNIIEKSDIIILSSNNALDDLRKFQPKSLHKARVINFVCQPGKKFLMLKKSDKKKILKKYQIKNNFYYVPNQFWKHKNHLILFKAVNKIKKKGFNINLVCSGHLHDYRNKDYFEYLQNYISNNSLSENIKILGLIKYEDVFALMKFSKAVINPSMFEGWSSTVEECKSIGKQMILSDISVHKEQYPEASFFSNNNLNSLTKVMINFNNKKKKSRKKFLKENTINFAKKYNSIAKEAINKL